MAASQIANLVEGFVGHDDNANVTTDISNTNKVEGAQDTGEKIKATVWAGKNKVEIGENSLEEGTEFMPSTTLRIRSGHAQAPGH